MARNKYPEVTIGRILDAATELFVEKGYESTTIQDIINALGDLSKGAIYHHFKSKEEIIIAVSERLNNSLNTNFFELQNLKDKTGLEKLRQLFILSLQNPDQETLIKSMPDLWKNPKLMSLQLESAIKDIAPNVIEPIIKQGVADGSIKTDYPKELSEVLILISNMWISPLIFPCDKEELYRRYVFFKSLMESLSINIFDQEILDMLERLRGLCDNSKPK